MPRDWSPEAKEKARQVALCVKPWLKSTGPKSKKGKAASSQNGRKPASLEMWWHCEDEDEKRRIWRRLWRAPQVKS
jgi:hypothetical protein